jgi:ABC-2 type transport system permease protein
VVLNFFTGWAPTLVVDTVAQMSFMTHFNAISRGVIDARDMVYFASVIGFFLFANVLFVDLKKAG